MGAYRGPNLGEANWLRALKPPPPEPDGVPVDWHSVVITFGLVAVFWTGIRLVREGINRRAGILLAGAATTIGLLLGISGSWAPVLYLFAAASLTAGVEIDRPGHPGRRALGLLGIAVWFVALVVAGVYS